MSSKFFQGLLTSRLSCPSEVKLNCTCNKPPENISYRTSLFSPTHAVKWRKSTRQVQYLDGKLNDNKYQKESGIFPLLEMRKSVLGGIL